MGMSSDFEAAVSSRFKDLWKHQAFHYPLTRLPFQEPFSVVLSAASASYILFSPSPCPSSYLTTQIALGSTNVRVGSTIFGDRDYSK